MLRYTTEQLASLVALPVIIILLCWTIAIFHKNRRRWGPYDIPIVSILVLSVLRNLTILGYTLAIIFNNEDFDTEYCSAVTWIFNSIHTFQASSLTSIAVIGLFSANLHRKNQNLRNFLTSSHIIYHLFCLTTLCACVGVAAILAQKDGGLGNVFAETFNISPCNFLPFELNIKFNIFIIVLHVFLAVISLASLAIVCYNYCTLKKDGFDYIKKSNSDLSELSNNYHGINTNVSENRNYYDTYTIHRVDNNNYCHKDSWATNQLNNSEVLSNNSTTVSSTNSRRPCIVKQNSEEDDEVDKRRTGLETMHPVLIVCYLFYHLPMIVLCVYPNLIQPWPVAGIALWLGLVQDLLIPIGLGIVDSRFCGWVTNVYRCSGKHTEEKLPQDGKFRPFGLLSQPQTLEVPQQDRNKTFQAIEHRFPITNGSLYTSIDGRLPVIHNYRRHKEFRMTGSGKQDLQSSNVALHSSYINRRDLDALPPEKYPSCSNCEADQCPSHSDLHHLSPQYVSRKLSLLQASQNNIYPNNEKRNLDGGYGAMQNPQNCVFMGNRMLHHRNSILHSSNGILENANRQKHGNMANKRLSQSQESINHLFYSDGGVKGNKMDLFSHKSEMNVTNFNLDDNCNMIRNSRNLIRLNKMRLSRSEDSLAGLQVDHLNIIPSPQKFSDGPNQIQREKVDAQQYSSDDEDCFVENQPTKEYDSLSSCNSITTEANCDFEFFQSREIDHLDIKNHDQQYYDYYEQSQMSTFKPQPKQQINKVKQVSNVRITRTNSKRSLENFQAYVEETSKDLNDITNDRNVTKIVILQRSNSYTTLEDRRRKRKGKKAVGRSNSKLEEKKIKSVEYLPELDTTQMYSADLKHNKDDERLGGSSVPDFKKIFISEYI
ncbi:uncharacterized protein LOC132706452 isoform X2 [Cylas formicarius]|uniref:uncharacterized protein LOC132706452 isoform X2 n=1 Tax=Cylas formicarius TaxID=197179 RepID=UPI002958B4D1|nr:uncharacterized protein LOC132706452 isoform X2 [Cylas formicarius]